MTDSTPRLDRALGLTSAVALGLGSILGTGVFVSLGLAAGVVGAHLVVAVALAALVATANGLSSAQLAAAHPVSGGTYEYARRWIHPAAGFAAGWMFLAAKSASAATAALGCAGYLLHLFGASQAAWLRTAVGVGLVIGFTALVAGGLSRSNRANAIIVGVTVSSLLAFVGFGWMSLPAGQLAQDLRTGSWMDLSGVGRSELLTATALMFVAYTGYGRIATLGEEVKDPEHTIPRAVVVTLLVSAVLYVAVAATAVAVVGPGAFAAATRASAAPLEVVARAFERPEIATWVAVGAVTAMAGVLLNLILGLSRVMLAMARRGDLPRALAQLDPERSSPERAVWVMGAVVALWVGIGRVEITWSFSAVTVLIYYGLTNWAALRLPRASRRFPRGVSAAGLVSCFGLSAFVDPRIGAVAAGLLLVGFGLRAALRRSTGEP